jgi:hypothetical protein
MWGRILQIVSLVLLAVIVVAVVSPYFDLEPTTVRSAKRDITLFGQAVVPVAEGKLGVSEIFLPKPRMLRWQQACDVVARGCARLC